MVTESRELVVVPKFVQGKEISHAVLSGGKPVLAAGEAEIAVAGGEFVGLRIEPLSGHFKPDASSLQIAKDLFSKIGVKF